MGAVNTFYLRVADPRQGTFFCFGQKKVAQEKAAPDAALFLRSAALGPALSYATPVAGDSRPRPVGDPPGFLPKPFGAQVRHRGWVSQLRTSNHSAQFVSLIAPYALRAAHQ